MAASKSSRISSWFRLDEGLVWQFDLRLSKSMKWVYVKFAVPALALLALGVYFAGWYSSTSPVRVSPVPPPKLESNPVSMAARDAPSANAIFGPPLPLTEIYQRSTESVRTLYHDDWIRADEHTADLFQLVESFFGDHEPLPASVASPYAVDDLVGKVHELQMAVSRRDRLKAEMTANRISGLTVEMLSHYDWKVPVGLARLDYLGRDVVIWSEAGNMRMAGKRIERMRATWQQVRPLILRRGGDQEAANFDTLITQLTQTRNTARLRDLSDDIFQNLAALEALYR